MSVGYEPGSIRVFLYCAEDEKKVRNALSQNSGNSLAVNLSSMHAADCIATVLKAMAECALRIWPRWYGSELFVDSTSSSLEDCGHSFLAILELCRRNRNIEPAWLKRAIHLVSTGKRPLAAEFIGETQIRQLALALTNHSTEITLAVFDDFPAPHECGALPRAVEWIARESGLDVTVMLPRRMAANADLASLLYNARNWGAATTEPCGAAKNIAVASPPTTSATASSSSRIMDEDASEAERVIGAPHPKSKGERLLGERLARDAQLSELFLHNQPVRTNCGRTFIVDLLWRAGGVVVEVDGYYFHSNSVAFACDRDRDYRLLVSGYRVLRIPHDEVVRDVELAMEKIRDVVIFIKKSGSEANNVR